MKTSRCFAIALAVLLATLAVFLACGLARKLLDNNAAATPTTVVAKPTSTLAPAEKDPPLSTPTATSLPPSLTPTPTTAPFAPTLTPTTPSTSSLPAPSPTPLVITDPSLSNRELLDQQIRQAQVGQRFMLQIHDDHVERELAAYLATKPETVYRNVTVRFIPGLVELGGQVHVIGLWVPATVRGQITTRNCRPEATITEVEVGGLLTPKWARDYVADLIYDIVSGYPTDGPICLESVEVQEGEALVGGTKR